MITMIKIGGSLITDKTQQAHFRQLVMHRLANEIKIILAEIPAIQLIIGHGSGSFGHVEASKYNTISGVKSKEEWLGFTKVAHAAATLHHYVMQVLVEEKIPVLSFSPSASGMSQSGTIRKLEIETIERSIKMSLIPIIYGDVMHDDVLGGTITSTETVFTYLSKHLPVNRIILLGEVDGVYDQSGKVIKIITPQNFESVSNAIKGSAGTDVTGGMLTKVTDMLQLVQAHPTLNIQIINGLVDNNLYKVLTNEKIGTLIQNT